MELRNGFRTRSGVTTARQSQEKRDSTIKRKDFGKAWQVGDKLSVFFPIVWSTHYEDGEPVMVEERDKYGQVVVDENGDPVLVEDGRWDIIVYELWGHKVNDMKALGLGTSFLPSLTEVWGGRPVKFIRDENGEVVYDEEGQPTFDSIEGDVSYQFSRIAPLFVRGMMQQELDKTYKTNYNNEEFRRMALDQIRDKYDTKKNMEAPKPIIGRLDLNTVTEVVAVTVDSNDQYKVDKAGAYIYRLTNDKIDELQSLLDDLKYKPRDHEQNWFEVQITYNGDSNDNKGRAQAGRKAHPVGLTSEYLMEARDPNAFKALKDKWLDRLPKTSSTISAHCYLSRKTAENKILSALSYYMAQNSEYLDKVSSEKDMEMVTNNAYQLVKFSALDTMTAENLKTTIMNSYREYMAEHPEAKPILELATEASDYQEPDVDKMPSTAALLQGGDFNLPDDNDDMNV